MLPPSPHPTNALISARQTQQEKQRETVSDKLPISHSRGTRGRCRKNCTRILSSPSDNRAHVGTPIHGHTQRCSYILMCTCTHTCAYTNMSHTYIRARTLNPPSTNPRANTCHAGTAKRRDRWGTSRLTTSMSRGTRGNCAKVHTHTLANHSG
jgi:hypothetical protein